VNYCATRGAISLRLYLQLLVIKEITSRQTVGLDGTLKYYERKAA
jgi:hypothetical protein